MKVIAGVYGELSVDTAKLGIGVRLGVGVGDPTGGNIAGASVSIGGEITSVGSSVDLKYSQSAAAGTYQRDVNLVKLSSRFR